MPHLPKFISFVIRVLRSILPTAVYSLALVSVVSLMGHLWWMFDLFAHFRLQYLWLAALGAVAAVLFRQRYLLKLLFFSFAIHLVFVLPYIHPFATFFAWKGTAYEAFAGKEVESDLKVYMGNMLIVNIDYPAIAKSISEQQPDVFAAVEVPEAMYDQMVEDFPAYQYHHRTGLGKFGIVLFSTQPFEGEVKELMFASSRPSAIHAQISTAKGPVNMLVLHPVPPITKSYAEEHQKYFDAVRDYVETLDDKQPLIITGDFNSTPWSARFYQLQAETTLIDARRGKLKTSWPSFFPLPMRIPIDTALMSDEIYVTEFELGSWTGSDHLPIIFEIAIE